MSLLAEIAEGLAALILVVLIAGAAAVGAIAITASASTTDIAPRCADAPQPCKRRV